MQHTTRHKTEREKGEREREGPQQKFSRREEQSRVGEKGGAERERREKRKMSFRLLRGGVGGGGGGGSFCLKWDFVFFATAPTESLSPDRHAPARDMIFLESTPPAPENDFRASVCVRLPDAFLDRIALVSLVSSSVGLEAAMSVQSQRRGEERTMAMRKWVRYLRPK